MERIKEFIFNHVLLSVFILIITISAAPKIIDGLTPVDTSTNRIYENSKHRVRIGATCRDGWHSNATGSGACSHHGGVSEWIYADRYSISIEECRDLAIKRSWIE